MNLGAHKDKPGPTSIETRGVCGRATIDVLASGSESPFAVTIPNVGDVGRYRVTFKADDRIVPHVDRRDRTAAEAKQP